MGSKTMQNQKRNSVSANACFSVLHTFDFFVDPQQNLPRKSNFLIVYLHEITYFHNLMSNILVFKQFHHKNDTVAASVV